MSASIDPARIWSSSRLPTLPTVAVRLLDLAKSPDPDLRQVVATVKADPAISAKILKAINSSFFGFRSEIATIERAVNLLGSAGVTSLALGFSLVEAARTSGPMLEHFQRFWQQSVVQAIAAETLCRKIKAGLDSEFFLAGLFLDLGRLAMLKTIPEPYLDVLEEVQAEAGDLTEAERRRLGFDHIEIGVRLMENWKLPPMHIAAARRHHASVEELAKTTREGSLFVHTLAVAAAVGDCFCAPAKANALTRFLDLTRVVLQWEESSGQAFLNEAKQRIDAGASLFSARTDDLPDPEELMSQAQDQLVRLTLQVQQECLLASRKHAQAEQALEKLERRANHDPLTGLHNRGYFEDAFTRLVEGSRSTQQPIGILLCDLDHFKSINDRFGHPFGDQVLQHLARVLQGVVPREDVLARFGGEEFAVLVAEASEKQLKLVAERIRAKVEASPLTFRNQPVHLTLSIGVAHAVPTFDQTQFASSLLEAADQALYGAKRRGRNLVQMATVAPCPA